MAPHHSDKYLKNDNVKHYIHNRHTNKLEGQDLHKDKQKEDKHSVIS